MEHSSGPLLCLRVNAILVPSGDQAGSPALPTTRRRPEPSLLIVLTTTLSVPKAIRPFLPRNVACATTVLKRTQQVNAATAAAKRLMASPLPRATTDQPDASECHVSRQRRALSWLAKYRCERPSSWPVQQAPITRHYGVLFLDELSELPRAVGPVGLVPVMIRAHSPERRGESSPASEAAARPQI